MHTWISCFENKEINLKIIPDLFYIFIFIFSIKYIFNFFL